jgi:hypothetical protein
MDLQQIKRLGEIVTKQSSERKAYDEKEKLRTERQRFIDAAPTPWNVEFWCSKCKKDFARMAHKIVQLREQWDGIPIAFYEARCPGNLHECRRRITDKTSDPYYHESLAVRKARQEMEIDMLQPSDPRFKKYWGDPYAKHNEELLAKEKAEWERKRNNP